MTPRTVFQPPSSYQLFLEQVQTTFRALLETKHLYQSLALDSQPPDSLKFPNQFQEREWRQYFRKVWIFDDPATRELSISTMTPSNAVDVALPDIKTFCANCDRVEPYNLVSCFDVLSRGGAVNHDIGGMTGSIQFIVLSYVCQSCKGLPETFLVRREGPKLTLSGRTPIEHVEVPINIPKTQWKFFSGAVVAHQSGQTLAANFLLRSLVEQFCYTLCPTAKNAENALDEYASTLPDDFKSRFPSLKVLYSDLSADIHKATGSADLFSDAINRLVEHFDARKLFKIGSGAA